MGNHEDGEQAKYQCPAGQRAIYMCTREERGQQLRHYWSSACPRCPIKAQCTTGDYRHISRWEHEPVLEAAQRRLDKHPNAMMVRRRTVEHVFGIFKHWMGSTHFLMRTLPNVGTVISLHVIAYNLKRFAVCQTKCNTFSKEVGSGDAAHTSIRQEGVVNMQYRQLTHDERHVMSNMLRQGYSLRVLSRALDRAPSTISRERLRNATRFDGAYRPQRAQEYAMSRRWRSRKKSQYSAQEWHEIDLQLQRKWSPGQIAGRRRSEGKRSMSKETIYRYIRRDRRDGGHLWSDLRILSKFARKRRGSPATRGRLVGKRHISERPKAVELRRQLGHWERDTVMGADLRHCVLTLVERATGYLVMIKLSARTKEQASSALARALTKYQGRFRTITLDNGTEFHGYEPVERRFKVKFYFATPYHSWERGTNENTNGLIRQYLPKGICLKHLTQRECNQISNELNDRPRERLGFRTPREAFSRY